MLFVAGCASSTPNNEHGPTFGPDAGSDATDEGDAGAPQEGGPETATGESGSEAGPVADASGPDASEEAGEDAGSEAGSDAGTDAPSGADASDGGFVAPTCDGVIGIGEYGGVANEQASTNGQVWYMTWDATNLYIAISSANVSEGDVVYVAVAPGSDAGPAGLTAGQAYDGTNITTLPFAASLVTYAHQGYAEARTPTGGVWGTPSTGAVQVCVNASTNDREEVIPWSLIGGRPASFGWFGYLAAAGNANGYIYGQMPVDDPGGGPANAETYTKYYAVPNATLGGDTPFADEQ